MPSELRDTFANAEQTKSAVLVRDDLGIETDALILDGNPDKVVVASDAYSGSVHPGVLSDVYEHLSQTLEHYSA